VSTDDELRDLFVFHVSRSRCRSAMPPSRSPQPSR
jgi:hypothetical protein